MIRRFSAWAFVVMSVLVIPAAAQSGAKPPTQDDRGLTSYVEFGGSYDADGQAYVLNSNVGYNFTQHFGALIGAPVYFIRPSASAGGTATDGIGNPYLNLHLKYSEAVVNFGSALTGFAPVGDSSKGLSTGRATFDWTNHFDHAFSDLTPFAEIGIANTTMDSRLFVRPYTTLGFNTHFQVGASYDFWKIFSLGASGYDILPSGQQTVFSRVTSGQGNAGIVTHGRVFQNNQQTTGAASIAQDDGFGIWLDANPGSALDLELGYTRSMVYDLNSIGFNIGINLRQLYRKQQQ